MDPKVMGWLGAVWVFFPESVLSSVQNLEVLCLWEQVSTVCIHVSLLVFCMSRVIWWSRLLRDGCVGLVERRSSRCRISRRALSDRLGMWPVGMWCLEAVTRVWRNWDSPVLQEEGASNEANASSVSRVYESQSALRRLV